VGGKTIESLETRKRVQLGVSKGPPLQFLYFPKENRQVPGNSRETSIDILLIILGRKEAWD